MKFSSALSCIIFFIVASTGGSSAELTQHRRSVTVASEDVTSAAPHDATMPDIHRELKMKKKGPKAKKTKAPKSGGKKPKSSKTLATESPSSPPTEKLTSPQPSSQPTEDPCVVEDISTQKDALLALKAGFTNGGTVLSDWAAGTDPCSGSTSNWGDKITCSDGEVTGINFVNAFLEGTIGPLIGCPTTTLVSSLTNLDFGTNKLTGTIPKELGQLTSLEFLNFMSNDITGSMPSEICNLRNDANGAIATMWADNCWTEVECTCCNSPCSGC